MKAVIFDLDGTLANLPISYDRIRRNLKDLFHTNNDFIPLITTVKKLSKDSNIMKEAFDIICNEEVNAVDNLNVIEGADELLRSLASKNFLIAIATMQCRRAAERVIDRLGIKGLFSCIQTRDENTDKISQIHSILEMLHVSPSQTIVIGDRITDVESANKMGCLAVLIGNDNVKRENQQFFSVTKLSEILDLQFFH